MNRRRDTERGIALIVVLSVIVALMLIATPFMISMLAHERSSQAYLMDDRAALASESAANSIVSYLYLTGEAAERRHEKLGLNLTHATYTYDLPVELTPIYGTGLPEVTPPPDQLSGVTVQDEQGKFNLMTAPRPLVNLITRIAQDSGARLADFTTIYSGRDAVWIKPMKIRSVDAKGLVLDTNVFFGPGARLRISRAGLPTLYVVAGAPDPTTGALPTRPAVPDTYADGVAEMEARHPVNILTAPHEVLVALFTGLTVPPDFDISLAEAETIAREIEREQPTSPEEFAAVILNLTNLGLAMEEVNLILTAAENPLHASITGGTMPITFRSADTFLIEASGAIVPTPGIQTAMRSLREVIRLSPPTPVPWSFESQADFQRFMGPSGTFPFGGRLYTVPGPIWSPSISLAPGDLAQVELRMTHAQDLRANAFFREHFPADPEGHLMADGEVLRYGWGQVFMPNPPSFDVRAGGFEMWFRLADPIPISSRLFDIRQDNTANHVSLEFLNGELVLTATDTGLPSVYMGAGRTGPGVSRVVTPFNPQPQTWYHVGAYWKSTKFGHLALLVDGFAHADSRFELADENDRMLVTQLQGAVAIGSTTLLLGASSVRTADGITALEVGREVVEYDPITQMYTRGARGTTEADHPNGAKVSLFGYRQKLHAGPLPNPLNNLQVDTLTIGRASLRSAFGDGVGMNWETGVIGRLRLSADFAQGATTFTAVGPNVADFPDEGYVIIMGATLRQGGGGQEVIKYTQKSNSGNFSGLTRAQLGTTDADHAANSQVFLYSIHVDSTQNYVDTGIIQIGDEWFPVRKHPSDQEYFLGLLQGGNHVPLTRAAFRTAAQDHVADDKVTPVFATLSTDMHRLSDTQAGRDDWVTIVDQNLNRRRMRIRHAATEARMNINMPPIRIDQTIALNTQLVAFDDWIDIAYSAADPEARLLKFPSGELLSLKWAQTADPTVEIASGCAVVDEIKFFANPKGNFFLATPVAPTTKGVNMNAPAGLSATGGIIKIGDEYLGYEQMRGTALNNCTRGYLNSPEQVHDLDRAFNLTGLLPIASIPGGVSAEAERIPLSQPIAANPEGYVLIEDEVVGYTSLTSRELIMPRTADGTGLYRGRFGTQAAQHGSGSLVYAIPFRYWDTYRPSEFDNTMAYFQGGTTVPDATWRTFRFSLAPPDGAPNDQPRVHAVVKLGQRAEWHDPTNVSSTPLFDFTDPDRDHALRFLRADTCDFRIFFEYPAGSFHPGNVWKRAARIKSVTVGYHGRTRTLYHEEGP